MESAEQDKGPTKSAWDFLAGARAALTFLTRVPCGKRPVSQAALAWAPAWFPVVGFMLGAAGSLVLLGLSRAGSMVASVATVAFLAFVTGAFHEDGLADSADALGGAFDRAKLFAILKDSRIGSFGAAALVLVLLLRITALAKLGPVAMPALVLSQTISRTTPVWLMAALPYVSPSETARSERAVTKHAGLAVIATVFASIATTVLLKGQYLPPVGVFVALAVSVLLAVVCGWRFHVRAGGITGDFLGATQQLTDAAILVALAASG
jgi:adenosylcobinamide-GDP ribazoletransferase